MKKLTITSILIGAFALAGSAQVNPRRENQQDRIAQGVQSGQLTPGETANLEKRESNINKEVRNDRAANGGHLTAAERAQVNRQQNRTSSAIYRDKHNVSADHFGNSEVGRRQENQQDRIAQGIRSGGLNANQTAHLERKEAAVNQQVHADRTLNNGKLSPAERRQVNREQNQLSRNIHRDKTK